MNTIDERNINPIEEMYRISYTVLNIKKFGFTESYRSLKPGKLIFDSEWCRLNFIWDGWDYLGGNNISIYYGRLHASNESDTMLWNDEECYCWHSFDHALHFLDARSPNEAVKQFYSHPIVTKFYSAEIRDKYQRRQPEWLGHMHATIWEFYGNRFFELFDLRNPELWEQYRQYLKEFYDIKGRSLAINPPLDKVC